MEKLRSIRKTCFILMQLLLMLAAGCAFPRTPEPMNAQEIDALRTRLGTIGITGAGHLPHVEVQTPSKGALHGALDGATVGALTTIRFSFEVVAGCSNAYCLFIPAAGLALAPAGAVVGFVGGALTADPREKVEERSGKINDALVRLRVQENMCNEFIARLSGLKTFPFTIVHETGPVKDGEKPDCREFQSSGIGSINEIDVKRLTLVGTGKVRPRLHVQSEVQGRLISTTDNAEIYCRVFTCSSKADTFKAWAAQDAKKFQEEIEACYHDVADWLVTDLYVHDSIIRSYKETQTPERTVTRKSTAKCH